MNINIDKQDSKLTIALTGRLDTTTAPELETAINENIEGITDLTFDFNNLDYISSAGLRTLLSSQKKINSVQGTMKIVGCNDIIKEAFEITGFLDILTVE